MLRPVYSVLLAAGVIAAGSLAARAQSMRERVEPHLRDALAQGSAFVSVSAASGVPLAAPASLASIFGDALATTTASGTAPYPTTLRGITVQLTDSAGAMRAAQLLFVSPGQINYLVPEQTAAGPATISLIDSAGNIRNGTMPVQAAAPGLFTANGNGAGVVAATAARRVIPSTTSFPVPVFQCGSQPGSCVSVPIDPGVDAPVEVTLYATGLRHRSSDRALSLSVGNIKVPIDTITSLDDSGSGAGVDLVSFPVLLNLRGSGEVDVFLTEDGVESNHGRINIQ